MKENVRKQIPIPEMIFSSLSSFPWERVPYDLQIQVEQGLLSFKARTYRREFGLIRLCQMQQLYNWSFSLIQLGTFL
jgi:hypothetical protein